MNKLFRRATGLFLAAVVSITSITPAMGQVNGQSNGACQTGGVLFGLFNGVLNTEKDADGALAKFVAKYGHLSPQGESIRYEFFYNITEGFDDFVEVFDQRLKEHDGILADRFELFFDALNGGGTWWDAITEVVPAFAGTLSAFVDWYTAAIPRMLTQMLGSPSTTQTLTEHRVRVDNAALEGRKMLFVAHSQGNLFVNNARNYALSKMPQGAVKVVHIAPASPAIFGPHVLADKDLVINALRAVGTVPSITDPIPPILGRTPGVNGKTDVTGHGLQEIYLHPGHETAPRIHRYILDALNTLEAPPVHAASGFFTATLTWDGTGDVDLHTTEPSGSHVYYSMRRGVSGFLDVDNVKGFGPEHYYASCDPTQLRAGTYAVSLANYSGAQGRNATVQIASNADGVLGTKTVTMGVATGSAASTLVFNVQVNPDPRTGKMRVSLGS